MMARPATRTASTKRHTQAVTRHRRASHPAVTSLAPSIAIAMPTTDIGAPGNSTTMPRMLNQAAAPASAIAATYAVTSATFHRPTETVTSRLISLSFSTSSICLRDVRAVTVDWALRLRWRRSRKAFVGSLTGPARNSVMLVSAIRATPRQHDRGTGPRRGRRPATRPLTCAGSRPAF